MFDLQGKPVRYSAETEKMPPHLLGSREAMVELELAAPDTVFKGTNTRLQFMREQAQQKLARG